METGLSTEVLKKAEQTKLTISNSVSVCCTWQYLDHMTLKMSALLLFFHVKFIVSSGFVICLTPIGKDQIN